MEVFSGKHAWRTHLRLSVIILCTPKSDVICVSYVCYENSHLDWTVRLTTLSSKELTPSDQNSHFEKISSGYILICMLIVGTAENGGHLYIWHIFILEPPHFLCRGVFIFYIGLFVKVTRGYPTRAVFPWNLRERRLIFAVDCLGVPNMLWLFVENWL